MKKLIDEMEETVLSKHLLAGVLGGATVDPPPLVPQSTDYITDEDSKSGKPETSDDCTKDPDPLLAVTCSVFNISPVTGSSTVRMSIVSVRF